PDAVHVGDGFEAEADGFLGRFFDAAGGGDYVFGWFKLKSSRSVAHQFLLACDGWAVVRHRGGHDQEIVLGEFAEYSAEHLGGCFYINPSRLFGKWFGDG